MQCILDGKMVTVELSEKSKRELKELEEKLDLPDIAKTIKCISQNAPVKT